MQSRNHAISIRALSKSYRLGTIGRHTLADEAQYLWHRLRGRDPRAHMTRIGRGGASEDAAGDGLFWALRDVSFDVASGEVIGIIGRNGAGKSTLLKLLTRITEPSSGEAEINGRVASLLEVGTGFHPELTGRENIYMNGTILGMKQREITAKFDEIVAFSEIEPFIDTPVKRYSSGMYVRLAFAVAAHLEPEILLIDEVLAVGDASFQRKCLGKMGDVARAGRTVLFVSHQMAAVQSLCGRVVWIDQGRLRMDASSEEVIARYLEDGASTGSSVFRRTTETPSSGTGEAQCIQAHLLDPSGRPTPCLKMGEGCALEIGVRAAGAVKDLEVTISLFDPSGTCLAKISCAESANMSFSIPPGGERTIHCLIHRLNLLPGLYTMNILLRRSGSKELLDRVPSAIGFEILSSDVFGTGRIPRPGGLVYYESEWK